VKIEMHNGDVVFKRAYNGWIIQKVVDDGDEYFETYVIEDISDDPSDRLLQALGEVGDLVRCLFQPRGDWDAETRTVGEMEHDIQNEFGIIVEDYGGNKHHRLILFPQFGYAHPIALSALEMICEAPHD
jgi:hypothetical protein